MHRLAVANFKGGVGKTTLAVNLAVTLARHLKKRVLLIDTDPSGNVSAQLRVRPQKTLYNLVMEEASLEDVLFPIPDYGPLSLIPSNRATQAAELQVAGQVGRDRILERILGRINTFDYMIFDTPPSISIMAQNAFVCARNVLIPISMDPMSLLGASTTVALLSEVRKGLDIECQVTGIVPTFVDSRLVINRLVMDAISERFKDLTLLPGVRTDATVRKATASQSPVVEFAPGSRAAQDFLKLAKTLDKAMGGSGR